MPELSMYWRTLRHLRPVQIYGRLWFRLYRPRPDLRPAPPLRERVIEFVEPCRRRPSLTGPQQCEFLNETGSVISQSDWNNPEKSTLWLYNLHYFDDLNAADTEKRAEWHRALLARWIAENPPGNGIGWAPYPTSLRIVNWVKWALTGGVLQSEMSWSLVVQTRWLLKRLEYHLLGNHLLANAKALLFAGLFFKGNEARAWQEAGIKLMSRELSEQILPDGGHFERSPMYHLIVLEDLLDLINLHRTYGIAYPAGWNRIAVQMSRWSQIMRHPDGEIPFFNDAAFGVACAPVQVDDYARRLRFATLDESKAAVRHLENSGYARLEAGSAVLMVDIAPVGPDFLPGHAHADTLSFELSLGPRRFIVNGGTSRYGSCEERHRQRSTAAHSTVVIDGQNSSEVWGGFRVARRSTIVESKTWCDGHICGAAGTHDGYRRLPGKPLHKRTWLLRSEELRIIDEITGEGNHRVEIIFPLGPGLRPDTPGEGRVDILDEHLHTRVLSLHAGDGVKIIIEPTTWHTEFGRVTETWRVRLLLLPDRLPVRHESILGWGA